MTTFQQEWDLRWAHARCVKEYLESRFDHNGMRAHGLTFPFRCGPKWAREAYDELVKNNFNFLSATFDRTTDIGTVSNERSPTQQIFSGQTSVVKPYLINVLDETLEGCPSPLRIVRLRLRAHPLHLDVRGKLPKPILPFPQDPASRIDEYRVIPNWASAMFACHRLSCLTYEQGAPFFPITFAFGNYEDPSAKSPAMDLILVQEDLRVNDGITLDEFIHNLAQQYRAGTVSADMIALLLDSVIDQVLLAIRTMSQAMLVHNDLHTRNVMVVQTNATHYEVHDPTDKQWRPTHGVTVRIIDFDWATVGIPGHVVAMSSMILDDGRVRFLRAMPHQCIDPRRDAVHFLLGLESALFQYFVDGATKVTRLFGPVGARLRALRGIRMSSVMLIGPSATVVVLNKPMRDLFEEVIAYLRHSDMRFPAALNHPTMICKRVLCPVSVQYMLTGAAGMTTGLTYSDGIRWCFDTDAGTAEETFLKNSEYHASVPRERAISATGLLLAVPFNDALSLTSVQSLYSISVRQLF